MRQFLAMWRWILDDAKIAGGFEAQVFVEEPGQGENFNTIS